ncbi:MAG: FG-GAP repeat protein [Alphaproteobacteria bacterium]|nr:FG-GAP repeat protein [Alphaproteobacteria bacterium]MCB9791293.1 FG-GAP repeat protein [Alphaproteobacteria bacterium]
MFVLHALLSCTSAPLPPSEAQPKVLDTLTLSERFDDPDAVPQGRFGERLEAAGDVDGDGYVDLLTLDFSHPDASTGAQVYLIYGSAQGPDPSRVLVVPPPDGDDSESFGNRASPAGDVNGDGYDDVLVAEPSDSDVAERAGAAWLFLGSAAGLQLGSAQKITARDGDVDHGFGYGRGGGDIDGDGYDDLLIGVPDIPEAYDSQWGPLLDMGGAYVLYGSAAGIDAARTLHFAPADADEEDHFGSDVALVDLNGDGHHDAIVGSRRRTYDGRVYAYLGGPRGLDLANPQVIEANQLGQELNMVGDVLAPAGDVDGDGYGDLVIGAWGADFNDGTTYIDDIGGVVVVYGAASGVDRTRSALIQPTDLSTRERMGAFVAGGGDLDGDGYDDVLVSREALDEDGDGWDEGAAYVLLGSSAGVSLANTLALKCADADTLRMGNSQAFLGDYDADGYADLALGTQGVDGESLGAFYVGSGAALLGVTVETYTWYADADGDGYGELDDALVSGDASPPEGYSAEAGDCDDGDAGVYPGAEEICGDGIDQDCDGFGLVSDDEDGDGLSTEDEQGLGSDPCEPDTDGDGLEDGEDPDPLNPESSAADDTGLGGGDKTCASTSAPASLWLLATCLMLSGRRRRGVT